MARATIIQSDGSEVAQNPEFINFSSNFTASLDNEGGVDVDIAQTGFTITNTTTDNTISVDQNGNVGTAVATDGAIHIENTGNTGIGLGVYTNIGATADAALVSIKVDNAAFDQTALVVSNDGVGKALDLTQNTTLAAGNQAVLIYSNAAQTNSSVRLVKMHLDEATSTQWVLEVVNDGTGTTFGIDNNNSGRTIYITHDDTGTNADLEIVRAGNNAALIPAIRINMTNAGAGDEAAFRFDGSEIVSAAVGGSQDKKIRISVAGTEYFIPCNTA